MKKDGFRIEKNEIERLLNLSGGNVKIFIALRAGNTVDDIVKYFDIEKSEVEERIAALEKAGLIKTEPKDFHKQAIRASKTDKDFMRLLAQAAEGRVREFGKNSIDTLYRIYKMGPDIDVLLFMAASLQEKNKYSEAYFEKMAQTWTDKGILHLEDMDKGKEPEESRIFKTVMEAFAIMRPTTPFEVTFIRKWEGYGFSEEIIRKACEKTIINTGKPSFKYCDSILRTWKAKGVETLSDVRRLDEIHKSEKKAAAQKQISRARRKQAEANNPLATRAYYKEGEKYDSVMQINVYQKEHEGETEEDFLDMEGWKEDDGQN